MKIQTLEVDKINPAAYNPRKDLKPGDPEYDKLKKSILEFDMVEPLVWNKKTGNLVGGHQRLKILKELGIKNVEVSVVDLSEVKEKGLNLALNKIQGEWDFPKLKDLLEELDTGDFDIEITGFDPSEIEDLMTQFHEPEEGLTPDDEVPEPKEAICKTGDLWGLGNHRLLCGDATIEADVAKLMAGEKADMVFTDPPYGINIVKGLSTIRDAKPFERVRQPGGKSMGVMGGDSGRRLQKLTGKVGKPGLVKPRLYYPVIGDDKPFDPLFLLSMAGVIILFGANHYASRLPDSAGWLVWDKGIGDEATFSACELIWTNQGNHIKRYGYRWSGMIRAGSREDELKDRVHPTQKPVGLCYQILEDYKTDIVLDLFGGSGSTLIACEKLSRKCYMMEIDPHYCDVIIERWQNFTGKQAVRIDGN